MARFLAPVECRVSKLCGSYSGHYSRMGVITGKLLDIARVASSFFQRSKLHRWILVVGADAGISVFHAGRLLSAQDAHRSRPSIGLM
jgi:hypothetical protein